MKLRPVLLVVLFLSAFLLRGRRCRVDECVRALAAVPLPVLTRNRCEPCAVKAVEGPMGNFELTQADAAPALHTEEQQNIAVYKKALPSVVNILSTAVSFRLLLWSGSASRVRVRVSFSRQAGTDMTNQPRHRQCAEG